MAREIIRVAVAKVFHAHFDGVNLRQVVQWFDLGGTLRVNETVESKALLKQLGRVPELFELTAKLGVGVGGSDALRASAAEFILEGLYAQKRISRNEEQEFTVAARGQRRSSGGTGRRRGSGAIPTSTRTLGGGHSRCSSHFLRCGPAEIRKLRTCCAQL